MPRTVTHDQLPAANALTSLGIQLGVLVGPAVGGLLVAYVGIGWCFLVDIGGLAVASLMFALMRPYPHRAETTPPSLAGIGEGLTYAFRRSDLLGTYLVDIAAMFLAIAGGPLPRDRRGGLRPAAAARHSLLRRDRRRARGHRAERVDQPAFTTTAARSWSRPRCTAGSSRRPA